MKILAVAIVLFSTTISIAQQYAGEKLKISTPKGANCAPPNKSTYLQYNNVRAMIHTAGNLWQIPGQNLSQYEIPKNSGIMAFFTSALWLGGTDVNGQLKLAALRYQEGHDYWTGPLSVGNAEIQPSECLKYDNHYATSQDKVREFNAWFIAGQEDEQNGTNLQEENFPGYQVPDFFKTWPAHGDVTLGQDFYLAPFFDRDQDGVYNYENGDYPWYDIDNLKDCHTDRRVSLYGDFNMWWVLNDKGNIHTETGGDPIGMEIHAQSFAFATNDDINNMTFYNYELINRGTQTLYNTYFGVFIDAALGNPFDDYVGCDVNRGLGYTYNGDAFDDDNVGFKGYGADPPAAGVDFFEGPYQDNDGIDNAYGIGAGEALNGIGYGDGIVDNERFGMRRFLYYINVGAGANPAQTDPTAAADYYNFLRGRWKDGTPFYYGGNAHISDPTADPSVPCDFMFPGDTDPLGWGTGGVPQPLWTEQTANNLPYDRRFLQSAGPFVLLPGAVNNITVGVAWARNLTGGDPFQSVISLRRADDKAQALFDNCFRVLEGPHAPDLEFQEMNNEAILFLSNKAPSNNLTENYKELDPFIATSFPNPDKNYRFQGYIIYQLKNKSVSVSDLEDPTKARVVAQCDLKDNVGRIINFEYDEQLDASIPTEKVDGENKGIRHSFRVTEDLFASGDRKLVNFKRYYYMAISYAYNNYLTYNPNDASSLEGQKKPFISSRKAPIGEIKAIEVIPHPTNAEANGTAHYAEYGFQPSITRLDGRGNGSNILRLSSESEEQLVSTGIADELTYAPNSGPIDVKIIDPLNVVGGYFACKFSDPGANEIDSSNWTIYRYDYAGGTLLDSVTSDQTIAQNNEQLIPRWGISVSIQNVPYYPVSSVTAPEYKLYADPLLGAVEYEDSTKSWLSFIEDDPSFTPRNWIRSGTYDPQAGDDNPALGYNNPTCYADKLSLDPKLNYTKLIGGGIAPYSLVGYQCDYMPLAYPSFFNNYGSSAANGTIARAQSVDIVLTSDKSKWTRCAVIEMCRDQNLSQGNAEQGTLRNHLSVDKNGNPDGTGTIGMGWFPGYAIDLESGYRLHMAFGENSFFGGSNGTDLIWNPTAEEFDENGVPVFGGQHAIYVFGVGIGNTACPYYDGVNNWVYDQFASNSNINYRYVYTNLMWVANPRLTAGEDLLSTDARIRVRINKEYEQFTATNANNGHPMYGWNMDGYQTDVNNMPALAQVLQQINIVPNPYYAFSEYERNKVDTRIKITNLPERCTVTIYNISGKLVNQFKKDNPQTFLDWTLTNKIGIPVSSGVYIVHVEIPGVGETVRKAFVSMRQLDIEGF